MRAWIMPCCSNSLQCPCGCCGRCPASRNSRAVVAAAGCSTGSRATNVSVAGASHYVCICLFTVLLKITAISYPHLLECLRACSLLYIPTYIATCLHACLHTTSELLQTLPPNCHCCCYCYCHCCIAAAPAPAPAPAPTPTPTPTPIITTTTTTTTITSSSSSSSTRCTASCQDVMFACVCHNSSEVVSWSASTCF